MKIYETAVRKPISTILIFVGVIVFGLFSLNNLAVDQYPDIEIPQIAVITSYAGANAADIETNITRVLEDNLNTVENLKKMTSKSSDNFSMITLEFEYGSDLTEAANDIRDAVSRTQSLLPDDVDYPTIFKFSSSMIPVMMLAVILRGVKSAAHTSSQRSVTTPQQISSMRCSARAMPRPVV